MLDRKALATAVIKKVQAYPYWQEVYQMARSFSGEVYLVGGKVYRSIIEIEHNRDCGSETSDWDFLLFGTSNQNRQFPGWKQTRGPGAPPPDPGVVQKKSAYTAFSAIPKAQRLSRSYERDVVGIPSKVDLIAIEDVAKIMTPNNGKLDLNLYFQSVPLDIQAIAVGAGYAGVEGHGLDAVRNKQVRINNRTKVVRGRDIDAYAQERADGLGLPLCKDTVQASCSCESRVLFNSGCVCGYVKNKNSLRIG